MTPKEQAQQIAECLFTCSTGEKADRLGLVMADRQTHGSWGQKSVARIIEKALIKPATTITDTDPSPAQAEVEILRARIRELERQVEAGRRCFNDIQRLLAALSTYSVEEGIERIGELRSTLNEVLLAWSADCAGEPSKGALWTEAMALLGRKGSSEQ